MLDRLDPLRLPMAGQCHQPRILVMRRVTDPFVTRRHHTHTERHKLWAEVGLFQFPIIQAVEAPRQKLADPHHNSPRPPFG